MLTNMQNNAIYGVCLTIKVFREGSHRFAEKAAMASKLDMNPSFLQQGVEFN